MEIKPRDIEFQKGFNDYSHLTTSALWRLTRHIEGGKDEYRSINRLKKNKDWGYATRADELKAEAGQHHKTRDAVYQRTHQGMALLLDYGIEPFLERPWFTGPFEHDFATSMSVVSLQIYAAMFGAQFLSPRYFAEKTQNEHPFTFEDVVITRKGQTKKVTFQPDYPIFGLNFKDFGIPIFGFETDMGSEIEDGELDRASVMKHILCYQATLKNFQGRFKLPSRKGFVLIQTKSLLRARSMVKIIEKNVGKSEVFCVTAIPQFARFKHRVAPTDELWKTEWLRAGHPPIVLSKPSTFTTQ